MSKEKATPAADAVEKKTLKLNDSATSMAEIIQKAAKLEIDAADKKKATVIIPDTTYHETLPEGLTPEIMSSVETHNANYIAAATHAVGVMAVAAMAGHKNLDSVASETNMGKNSVAIGVKRSAEFSNPHDKNEKITKYGAVSVTYDVQAGHAKTGQLGVARKMIAELAFSKLK